MRLLRLPQEAPVNKRHQNLNALPEMERRHVVLRYFVGRTIQAGASGGLDDPFVLPEQLDRRFGDSWPPVVESLMVSRLVLAFNDGLSAYVLARGRDVFAFRQQYQEQHGVWLG